MIIQLYSVLNKINVTLVKCLYFVMLRYVFMQILLHFISGYEQIGLISKADYRIDSTVCNEADRDLRRAYVIARTYTIILWRNERGSAAKRQK